MPFLLNSARASCRDRLRSLLLVSLAVALTCPVAAQTTSFESRPWNRDLIYFVMTDRFLDGDPDNNRPVGSDPALYDPDQRDINRYHGGDFRGLELAIRDGYFTKLGVTAIWITPPVRNAWNSSFDLGGPKTGYHGYWAQDFLDIDPHLVSAESLDGEPYSDDREGRLQHYRDLVELAHEHDIKIVQDIVCNHIGPLFFYDNNGNDEFDLASAREWISPYKDNGFYNNAAWANVPKWNLRIAQPDGPMNLLGSPVATRGTFQRLDVYGRKGFSSDSLGKNDGEEVKCDFFSLRDFWTKPGSPHFDELVDEFVEIYAFYVETVGVDGFRIDTVKHVHHEFWDAFTERLRDRVGAERASKMLLFGEVYDGNPKVLGRYTYRTDFPDRKDPCLDSLLNFQYCFNLRDYLRVKDGDFGSPAGLMNTFNEMNTSGANAFYNPEPGPDGLSARQKLVNFYENHDGINRFLSKELDASANRLALGITLMMEGVPCIYYGSELPLRDLNGEIGRNGETGRLTFGAGGDLGVLEQATESSTFQMIKELTELRDKHSALNQGRMIPLWADRDGFDKDNGVFAFARYLESGDQISTDETIIVVINADSTSHRETGDGEGGMRLVSLDGKPLVAQGDQLETIAKYYSPEATPVSINSPIEWRSGVPHVRQIVEARSITILKVR